MTSKEQQWDYLILLMSHHNGGRWLNVDNDQLIAAGREGWELVAVDQGRAYLKARRETPPPSEPAP